jgi:hypothetical protein
MDMRKILNCRKAKEINPIHVDWLHGEDIFFIEQKETTSVKNLAKNEKSAVREE